MKNVNKLILKIIVICVIISIFTMIFVHTKYFDNNAVGSWGSFIGALVALIIGIYNLIILSNSIDNQNIIFNKQNKYDEQKKITDLIYYQINFFINFVNAQSYMKTSNTLSSGFLAIYEIIDIMNECIKNKSQLVGNPKIFIHNIIFQYEMQIEIIELILNNKNNSLDLENINILKLIFKKNTHLFDFEQIRNASSDFTERLDKIDKYFT